MAQRTAIAEQIYTAPLTKAERPIDLVHLAKQCLGDEHLEYEIMRIYDTTVKTYFDRLKLSSSHDDLMLNLHSIKGASGGVGAFSVANLAKTAEVELQAGRPLSPERIDDLGMAIEEVRAFIAHMLDNEPA
jgi:HPt (histidine-containing phosphotransfer) domain-containing protein